MTDHELCNDIIEALRYQVMRQNEEINSYREWIRKIAKDTPHKWLKEEASERLQARKG